MDNKASIGKDRLEGLLEEHADKQYKPLRDRRALVVGAHSNNIGDSIAGRLTDMGVKTATVDLSADGVNIASQDGRQCIEDTHPDLLVMCNGQTELDWIGEQSYSDVGEIVYNSLTATIVAINKFVQVTIDDPWRKSIICVGSMAHSAVLNGSSAYCAAKAGLHHYVRCAGWELTPKGYTLGIVHPSNTFDHVDMHGRWHPDMTEHTIQGLMDYQMLSREVAEDYWGSLNLMNRWLCSEDIAEVVTMFATADFAKFMSGSAIELKAGQR